MRVLRLLIVALLTMTPLVLMPSANANIKGCDSKAIRKIDGWTTDKSYPGINSHGGPTIMHMRHAGVTEYFYCPNGSKPNKIKILHASWCWTIINQTNGRDIFYDGAKFDAKYSDMNTMSNPPKWRVRDDGSRQNCDTQFFAPKYRKWLQINQAAHWWVSTTIVRDGGLSDIDFFFKYHGNTIKMFNPANDPNVGDWV